VHDLESRIHLAWTDVLKRTGGLAEASLARAVMLHWYDSYSEVQGFVIQNLDEAFPRAGRRGKIPAREAHDRYEKFREATANRIAQIIGRYAEADVVKVLRLFPIEAYRIRASRPSMPTIRLRTELVLRSSCGTESSAPVDQNLYNAVVRALIYALAEYDAWTYARHCKLSDAVQIDAQRAPRISDDELTALKLVDLRRMGMGMTVIHGSGPIGLFGSEPLREASDGALLTVMPLSKTVNKNRVPRKFRVAHQRFPYDDLLKNRAVDRRSRGVAEEALLLLALCRVSARLGQPPKERQRLSSLGLLACSRSVLHSLVLEECVKLDFNPTNPLGSLENLGGDVDLNLPKCLIRDQGENMLVDAVATHYLFEQWFGLSLAPADSGRGNIFEEQLRNALIRLGCSDLPQGVMLPLGKKLKDATGATITDVDALYIKGDVCLFINAKSKRLKWEYLMGDRNAILNVRDEVTKEYREWAKTVERLNRERSGSNYDINLLPQAVPVICLPEPVYLDLAVAEIFAMPDLPAICSVNELMHYVDDSTQVC